MSHIHNLTSHLKNTTVTPTSPPEPQNFRVSPNGLKIYQLVSPNSHREYPNNMQQQQQRLLYPPAEISGRKGPPQITPPNNNHHFNSANFLNHQNQSQNHSQHLLLQSQLRKPPVLNNHHLQPQQHQQRMGGQVPPFANPLPAHQASQPAKNTTNNNSGVNNRSPVANRTPTKQNHTNHVNNNYPTISRQLSQPIQTHSSPTKPTQQFTPSNHAMMGDIIFSTKPDNIPHSQQNGNSSAGAARLLANHGNNANGISQKNHGHGNGIINMIKDLQAKKKNVINNTNNIRTQPPPSTTVVPVVPKTEASSTVTKSQPKTPCTPTKEDQAKGPPQSPNIFKKGDDVLYTTDDGTFMFGTVGMIHGQTLQILFGDGTQELASYLRVKLLVGYVDEPKDEEEKCNDGKNEAASASVSNNKSSSQQSRPNRVSNGLSSPDLPGVSSNGNANASTAALPSEEVTCGSCGVVKKVAGKKALNYAPHTKNQFNCRRCLNKSRFSKNSLITPTSNRKLENSSPNSTSAKGPTPGSSHRQSGPTGEKCFHCEKYTNYNDRLHCNLCERDCHLSCLAMTPTPLDGDGFWDVICSSCGTQNGESGSSGRTKVFSCRRSISSWSDVAHLVLSCLASRPEHLGERFFDLEKDIIPFIDDNLDRLHLPRAYKNIHADHRKTFLSTALHNATLRFLNGKDVQKKATSWAIRDIHQYPTLRLHSPQKNNVIVKSQSASTSSSPRANGSPRLVRSASTCVGSSSTKELATRSSNSPASKSLSLSGSSRTLGHATPKRKSPSSIETPPPKLDRQDASSLSSPSKGKIGNRAMSQTERLVQKAKKQCLQKTPDSNKRKTRLSGDFSSSPDPKRLKLTLEKSPLKLVGTPGKQMSEWLENLNKSSRNSPGTPGSELSPLFGRAVKSAGITPPGSGTKPGLRIRKPKTLNLKGKDKEKIIKKLDVGAAAVSQKPPTTKSRGRGRPLKAISNAVSQKFAQIPVSNGTVPEAEENIDRSEFSVLKSTVEDLILCASSVTIHWLPKPPETELEKKELIKKAEEQYARETVAPPSYLKQLNGAKPRPLEKSKRDLNDPDSYYITGSCVDGTGQTRYYCEWKDGYGNDDDDEEEEDSDRISFDVDEKHLDNADLLWEMADKIQEDEIKDFKEPIANGERSPCDSSNQSSVVVDDTVKPKKVSPDNVTQVIRLYPGVPNRKNENIIIDLTSDSP